MLKIATDARRVNGFKSQPVQSEVNRSMSRKAKQSTKPATARGGRKPKSTVQKPEPARHEPSDDVTVYVLQVDGENGKRCYLTESMDLETAHEMFERMLGQGRRPVLWSFGTSWHAMVAGEPCTPTIVKSFDWPNKPDSGSADASIDLDDSESVADAEEAPSGIGRGHVAVYMIRYTCPYTGERAWWCESLTKKHAGAICRALKRRGCNPERVKLELGVDDALGLAGLTACVQDEGLEFYAASRRHFVRSMLSRQLRLIARNIDLVEDTGDIGVIAWSLRAMCQELEDTRDGDTSHYDLGDTGQWDNDALEEVLGIGRQKATAGGAS